MKNESAAVFINCISEYLVFWMLVLSEDYSQFNFFLAHSFSNVNMDQCCSNAGNIFVQYLQSVTCWNLSYTFLKVFACLKLHTAVFPEVFYAWNRSDLKKYWQNSALELYDRLCPEHNGGGRRGPLSQCAV